MRPTRVYIAAPWKDREKAKVAAVRLREAHIEVTSHWHDIVDSPQDPVTLNREGQRDWNDVNRADAMLVLNFSKSEGKAVEQGMALQKGIPIVVLGEPTNIFHHLTGRFTFVDTLGKAIDALPVIEPTT